MYCLFVVLSCIIFQSNWDSFLIVCDKFVAVLSLDIDIQLLEIRNYKCEKCFIIGKVISMMKRGVKSSLGPGVF